MALAYLPGLKGGFLFDDFANLPVLGATGPVTHWDTFWRYITSGTADPTGRPMALLSFLLDAHNWPADPHPFKRTNLLLHLANGLLLFLLLARLGRTVTIDAIQQRRTEWAAVLGASLWMTHPLFVSTTLYIVQREAMLPVTFTLLGLLAWLRGREKLFQRKNLSGLAWLLAGLGACTTLAVLSKANGVLLPALALVLEYFLLTPAGKARATLEAPPPTYRRAMVALAGLPTLVIAAYLVHAGWQGMTMGISDARPWTLGQRLLTEPRVLFVYLRMLWMPTPYTAGLFHDEIRASSSLLHPWTTLPSILALLGLLLLPWRIRRTRPAFAAAIMFFFVGQSIESSSIALELFFEHRNYLPSLLMFWPMALWLSGAHLRERTTKTTSPVPADAAARLPPGFRAGLAAVLCAALVAMTWARASLWGNPHDLALLWAHLNPASSRAQAFAAQAEISSGQPQQAIRRLQAGLVESPNDIQLSLNLVAAECAAGTLDQNTLGKAEKALATARDSGSLLTSWFGRAIDHAGECAPMDLPEIERLLLAAQSNPLLRQNHGRQQDLYYLRGLVALRQARPDRALSLFDAGLQEQPREGLGMIQAAALGSAGYPAQGLAHLALLESLPQPSPSGHWTMQYLHGRILHWQEYWPTEMARLRDTLRQDLHDSRAPTG
ncbi:MAG: hypothetical protein ABT19_02205 [Rhodanobacter sp. SCN 68-63]|nr:MAG: hypothetical protein ABT19_02205 [Rhodanobacter sp. SCN 68-63]